MFVAWKRPGGRNNKSADLVVGSQFSVHLRKPKIVADVETKMQTAKLKAREGVARSKAGLFFDGRDRIQVSLAILSSDVALFVDKNLRIVN